jgi:organic radical activating enzyme
MTKPFCVVPWNHVAMRASRRFGLCCLSHYKDDESKTFEEHWNSPGMKQIRVDMMNNTPSELCKRCKEGKSTPGESREIHNEMAKDYIDEMLDKTSSDGFTTFIPRTIDLRTDHCNFKCKFCVQGSSTSIRAEEIKLGRDVAVYGPLSEVENLALPDGLFENLEYAYWSGGEPFMSPIHWRIMEKLVKIGNTKPLIRYNTNLSFPGSTINKAINLLKNFENIEIGCSIEGFGEDAEYLRDGLVFDDFSNNIRLIQENIPHAKIMCIYNATSLGLLSLVELLDHCENDLKIDIIRCGTIVLEKNNPLGYHALNPKTFSFEINRILDYAKTSKFKDQIEQYVNFLLQRFDPREVDIEIINDLEKLRGKQGYFENRMSGKYNVRRNKKLSKDVKIKCLAPWSHLHVNSTGEFGLCQVSNVKNGNNTFEEHWNSVKMKNIRISMINGNLNPLICNRCISKSSTFSPMLEKKNNFALPFISEILDSTKINGETTFDPRSVEIRMNDCNLACRICNDASSSKIRDLKKAAGLNVSSVSNKSLHDYGMTEERISKIENVLWSGGEPFMSSIHWELMEKLVEMGRTDVKVIYNTNFTFPEESFERAIKLLTNFKNVKILASLDGTGEDVEYLRKGMNYSDFCKNLEIFKEKLPHVKIAINFTATSMGIFTLDGVIQLCLDHNLEFEGRNAILPDRSEMSINAITPEALNDALNRSTAVASGTVLEPVIDKFVKFLRSKYMSVIFDRDLLKKNDLVFGQEEYFEKRMKGLFNV